MKIRLLILAALLAVGVALSGPTGAQVGPYTIGTVSQQIEHYNSAGQLEELPCMGGTSHSDRIRVRLWQTATGNTIGELVNRISVGPTSPKTPLWEQRTFIPNHFQNGKRLAGEYWQWFVGNNAYWWDAKITWTNLKTQQLCYTHWSRP